MTLWSCTHNYHMKITWDPHISYMIGSKPSFCCNHAFGGRVNKFALVWKFAKNNKHKRLKSCVTINFNILHNFQLIQRMTKKMDSLAVLEMIKPRAISYYCTCWIFIYKRHKKLGQNPWATKLNILMVLVLKLQRRVSPQSHAFCTCICMLNFVRWT